MGKVINFPDYQDKKEMTLDDLIGFLESVRDHSGGDLKFNFVMESDGKATPYIMTEVGYYDNAGDTFYLGFLIDP